MRGYSEPSGISNLAQRYLTVLQRPYNGMSLYHVSLQVNLDGIVIRCNCFQILAQNYIELILNIRFRCECRYCKQHQAHQG